MVCISLYFPRFGQAQSASLVGYGYDFTNTGAGAYTVKLWRDYFWVLIDGVITKAKIDVQSSTVNINGKLAADIPTEDDEVGGIDNRAVSITTRKCSPLQELVVNRAAEIADDYLSESRRLDVRLYLLFPKILMPMHQLPLWHERKHRTFRVLVRTMGYTGKTTSICASAKEGDRAHLRPHSRFH